MGGAARRRDDHLQPARLRAARVFEGEVRRAVRGDHARFGDPETEAVLPRLEGDLIPALEACVDGTLCDALIRVRPDVAATVIMAAGGYPGAYTKGTPIHGLDEAAQVPDSLVFHAGTALKDGRVVTAGGRVLAVTALGPDLKTAVGRAYEAASKIRFEGAHYRTDIAHRAFSR